jgi:hypothetical protein
MSASNIVGLVAATPIRRGPIKSCIKRFAALDQGRASSMPPIFSGAAAEPAAKPEGGKQPQAGGGAGPERDLQPPAGGEPGAPTGGERLTVEDIKRNAPPGAQDGDISDSLYEDYEPQRVKIKGAKKHPGPLVESAAMSSVLPPQPTYSPTLPKAVISEGQLSLPQLEAVVYAGQAHQSMLPAAEGQSAKATSSATVRE